MHKTQIYLLQAESNLSKISHNHSQIKSIKLFSPLLIKFIYPLKYSKIDYQNEIAKLTYLYIIFIYFVCMYVFLS